mmetsp:Transcript_127728/g.367656  ORF Transcript_127728/g.367656 Transcript_127728/m.367656 type:complete len:223 (+) Transcript_127728:2-670(+)
MAVVALFQFGAVRFADKIDTIGGAYLVFMGTGFNRFFDLGFLMTHARMEGPLRKDSVQPLLSEVWPVSLLLVTVVAPSTNWDLAGMLTYPFFHEAGDRLLYVGGAVTLVFVLDRVSRGVHCTPLPGVLGQTSLALYLFHPLLITGLLQLGMRSVMHVWISAAIFALAVVSGVEFLRWSSQGGVSKVPRDFDNLSPLASEANCRSSISESDDDSATDGDATGA